MPVCSLPIGDKLNPKYQNSDEPKNAPELPIGRFLKSKSLGGNRVILTVTPRSTIR
jgi:hypothetical protein